MPLPDENIELPIQELEKRIDELTGIPGGEDRTPEIDRLRQELQDLRGDIYLSVCDPRPVVEINSLVEQI